MGHSLQEMWLKVMECELSRHIKCRCLMAGAMDTNAPTGLMLPLICKGSPFPKTVKMQRIPLDPGMEENDAGR